MKVSFLLEKEEEGLTVEFSEPASFETVVDVLFTTLDAVLGDFIKQSKFDKEGVAAVCDDISEVCGRLIDKHVDNPYEFTLTDAAIIKAQNEIIHEAKESGKTFNQVLEEYNKKAQDVGKMS